MISRSYRLLLARLGTLAKVLTVPPDDVQMPPDGELLENWFAPGWRLASGTGRRCRLAVSLWR